MYRYIVVYVYTYIYIYIERERDVCVCVYIYIYINIPWRSEVRKVIIRLKVRPISELRFWISEGLTQAESLF